MSMVILFAAAVVILGVSALTLTSTNVQQFVRQNFKHIVALSALLVPMVAVLSACNSVAS